MENSNSFGVHFFIRRNKGKDGKYPVYAKISVNGDKSELSLKIYVSEKHWNDDKGLAKPKDPELIKLNTSLEKVRSKMTQQFQQMELNDERLTALGVKKRYLNIDKPQKSYSLIWLVKEHNTKMKGTLAPGTLKNYETTLEYVEGFLKNNFDGDIYIRHLEYEFIEDLKNYILDNPIKEHDGCTNNGVMKHLERVKKIVKWACKNRWLDINPFQYYSLKFDPTDIKFLTKDQLDKLQNHEFKQPRLELVRDLFLFSCYTGLAYCDLMDAGNEKVKIDAQGRKWLYTRRGKSKIKADIPLLPTALDLINKYNQDPRSTQRRRLFPLVTNQDMNRCLKIIMEILEFDIELTHHVARHTFATLLIMFGVPVTTVQKIMGHTKLTTTMIYVHLLNMQVGDDMQAFWVKLEGSRKAS